MFDFFVFLSIGMICGEIGLLILYDIFAKAILIWSNVYYEL